MDGSQGRTASIFLFSLMSFGTLVLMLVPFLSQHSKFHVSFLVAYIWEVLIFCCAIIAMVVISVLRNNSAHLTVIGDDLDRKQTVILQVVFAILGVSSTILPFYESGKVSTCFNVQDRIIHGFQFSEYFFVGLYILANTVFIIVCNQYRCKSFVSRVLVTFIIGANFSLLCNTVLNIIRSLNTIHHSNNNTTANGMQFGGLNKNITKYYFQHTLVFSVCENDTEVIDQSETTQGIYKYTYPFLGEFLLLGLIYVLPLWNIYTPSGSVSPSISTDVQNGIESDNSSEQTNDHGDTLLTASHVSIVHSRTHSKLVSALLQAIGFVSKYSVIISIVFAATVLVVHMIIEVEDNERFDNFGPSSIIPRNLTSYDVAFYYLQTVYTYVISVVPFIAYFISRPTDTNTTPFRYDISKVLLVIAGCGHIFLVVFETVDSLTVLSSRRNPHLTENVMYFIKLLFHYVGIVSQITFLFNASNFNSRAESFPDQKLHVKGILVFLGVCNMERWLVDSFLPPSVLKYANDIQGDDTFGHVNWWVIAHLLFPVVIFYRLWSSWMCFKIYDNLRLV